MDCGQMEGWTDGRMDGGKDFDMTNWSSWIGAHWLLGYDTIMLDEIDDGVHTCSAGIGSGRDGLVICLKTES